MVATETDGLLTVPHGSSDDRPSSSRRNSSNNWALVVVVSLLIATLIVDICLRDPSASHSTVARDQTTSTATATTLNPHSKGRYYATQFISFTINTLGGLADHGECDNKKVDPKSNSCYLGNKNLQKDVDHRLMILDEVLTTLRNDVFKEDPEIDRDPRVLKIMMMPEFYLRGPNGAYSTKEMFDSENDEEDGLLIKLADRVREMIADPAFEDYLFVFGTVIAAEPINPDDGISADANDVMYFNFAPFYRGGAIDDTESIPHQHRYVVLKQYISSADFLSRTTLPNPSEFDLHAYAKADRSAVLGKTFAKRNVTVITDNYVEIDGIKIGIEICLDHRMGSLWNNLRTKHNSELVDVQLIISAGMSIERGPNPIKPGGVVYLSDGEASSAACMRTDTGKFDPNHICRGKPGGLKHLPHGGAGYSNFFALAGCIDMEKSHLLKGYYSLYQPQGCANTLKTYGIDVMDEFAYYPPSLEIYPTVNLP